MAGIDAYRTGWRNYVRGLWNGAIDKEQFIDNARTLINRRLMQAWLEGAAKCGITEEDLTDKEYRALGEMVKNEIGFLDGLTDAIVKNSKKNDGSLEPLFTRVERWVGRYDEAKARGEAMACADQKALFELGPTENHCRTCTGFNGRVYRFSTWNKYEAIPPHNWNFECRGGCQCRLTPTDKPITKGKFPTGLLAN